MSYYTRKVLFVCTGNYYRSRFAEILFNYHSVETGLQWEAFSRGLATEKSPNNVGPISSYALEAFSARGISSPECSREPVFVEERDFETTDMIIALKDNEHRPIFRCRFPHWEPKVVFWHIHDVEPTPAYDPMLLIETNIHALIDLLNEPSFSANY
ncbi:MAG: low molecular weight phosphatase family protein [Chitinivibrionales bacterium]|nr:low molecular weight phosphatase family protein [Chitinivibrionales bacterium]